MAPGWGPERRGAVQGRSTGVRRFLLGGTVAGRAGQAGCGGAPPAWVARSRQEPRRPAPAALCPPLLGEGREHAQVREVLDVIVAGPLGRVSGHGQHVLREGRREGRGRSAPPPGHLRVPGAQPAAPPHAHLPWGSPGVSGGPQMSTPGSRYPLGGAGSSQQVNRASGHNPRVCKARTEGAQEPIGGVNLSGPGARLCVFRGRGQMPAS